MEPFLGEIKAFAGTYIPDGWLPCDGTMLPVSKYSALFSLLGTTYGGDGQTNFALPDLQGRLIVQSGQLTGGANYPLGEAGGEVSVTLNTATMAGHTHSLLAGTVPGVTNLLHDNYLAAPQDPGNTGSQILAYLPDPGDNTAETIMLNTNTLTSEGGSQPHENRQPFLCITYIIAVQGIYPSFQQ
ncbi:MAG: tail fiber protein [Chitinophagaceae bacterium]